MKTYTRQFLKKLGEKMGADENYPAIIRETEEEMSRILPDDFDFARLKEIVCDVYGVSIDEFDSSFRYGNLGNARQALCYAMYYLGARNKQIAEATGFMPARISNSVSKVKRNNKDLLKVETIIKNYHALHSETQVS